MAFGQGVGEGSRKLLEGLKILVKVRVDEFFSS
jgi:hypothetical protein